MADRRRVGFGIAGGQEPSLAVHAAQQSIACVGDGCRGLGPRRVAAVHANHRNAGFPATSVPARVHPPRVDGLPPQATGALEGRVVKTSTQLRRYLDGIIAPPVSLSVSINGVNGAIESA